MSVQHTAVVGAGTMGNGIAHVFALHGYDVTLIDLDESLLDDARTTIESNLSRQVNKDVSDAVPHRPGPDHGGVLYGHAIGK